VNVPNDTVRNTAHKPSLYAAQPSTPHHHQTSVYLIGQDDDLLDGPAQPGMRSRHLAAGGFDLLSLGIQDPLSFSHHGLLSGSVGYPRYFGARIDVHRHARGMHDVQL
jgi:hypothetical protein